MTRHDGDDVTCGRRSLTITVVAGVGRIAVTADRVDFVHAPAVHTCVHRQTLVDVH